MVHLRVSVLGPARLEVDGRPVRLTPLTTRLLIRLLVAEGEAVPVRQLRRDVWSLRTELPRQAQRSRNEVQKRILELRRALDLAHPGDGARILRTEQLSTASGPESAYRLVLGPGELDSAEFTDLVNGALHAAPASAVHQLTEALRLVRGRPLAEAGGEEFAGALTRRLTDLRETACRELIRNHTTLGRYDLALPVAEQLVQERPDDPEATEALAALRARLREQHGDELLRHTLPGLPVDIVVVRGDLFDQVDANLVVGFADTFDTATDQDFVISRDSVQGQLVDRVFGGDRRLLDDKLRRGLKAFDPLTTESVQDKPRGRRTRYPVGTAVPLPVGGRRVFATAYSRLGNNLIARSAPADLRQSLESLWPTVALHGLFKPVAMPLIGSGLARVVELSRTQLMMMIIETFAQSVRRDPTVAPELRIVLRPGELAKTDLSAVEKFLRDLHGSNAPRSTVHGSDGR